MAPIKAPRAQLPKPSGLLPFKSYRLAVPPKLVTVLGPRRSGNDNGIWYQAQDEDEDSLFGSPVLGWQQQSPPQYRLARLYLPARVVGGRRVLCRAKSVYASVSRAGTWSNALADPALFGYQPTASNIIAASAFLDDLAQYLVPMQAPEQSFQATVDIGDDVVPMDEDTFTSDAESFDMVVSDEDVEMEDSPLQFGKTFVYTEEDVKMAPAHVRLDIDSSFDSGCFFFTSSEPKVDIFDSTALGVVEMAQEQPEDGMELVQSPVMDQVSASDVDSLSSLLSGLSVSEGLSTPCPSVFSDFDTSSGDLEDIDSRFLVNEHFEERQNDGDSEKRYEDDNDVAGEEYCEEYEQRYEENEEEYEDDNDVDGEEYYEEDEEYREDGEYDEDEEYYEGEEYHDDQEYQEDQFQEQDDEVDLIDFDSEVLLPALPAPDNASPVVDANPEVLSGNVSEVFAIPLSVPELGETIVAPVVLEPEPDPVHHSPEEPIKETTDKSVKPTQSDPFRAHHYRVMTQGSYRPKYSRSDFIERYLASRPPASPLVIRPWKPGMGKELFWDLYVTPEKAAAMLEEYSTPPAYPAKRDPPRTARYSPPSPPVCSPAPYTTAPPTISTVTVYSKAPEAKIEPPKKSLFQKVKEWFMPSSWWV